MARIAGRSSRLYVALTNGGEASPVSSTRSFSIESTRDSIDATCQGDTSKVSLTGLPGGSGQFSGVFDTTATGAAFAAAIDGLSRKVYGYMSASTSAYFYCTALFSASLSASVDGLCEVTGTWNADTPVVWVGV